MENIKRALAFLQETFAQSEYFAAHPQEREYRYRHSLRVANICRLIAEAEDLDRETLVISGLLHDIAYCNTFEGPDGYKEHGRLSARIAEPFLRSLPLEEKQVADILYGIAAHVDDDAGMPGEKTALTMTVGDADNIDRFDAYRIVEGLNYDGFEALPAAEQLALLDKRLAGLERNMGLEFFTPTATALWREKLAFQQVFFRKLREQLAVAEEDVLGGF